MSTPGRSCRSQFAQATVEWIGLVLLVALAALGLAATGVRLPGLAVLGALGGKLVCVASLGSSCGEEVLDPALVAEYGPDLAADVAAQAPRIEYEQGMHAVPVDFRACRRDPCSLGPETGAVTRTDSGNAVTLFTHVIDCRAAATAVPRQPYDCSGDRAGHVYLQYWAYYPGSQSLRGLPGNPGYHPDDWESFQVRLGGEPQARASSHQGYNYEGGAGNWLSDAGVTSRPAWGADERRYYVSGGSHAGHAHEDRSLAGLLAAGAGSGGSRVAAAIRAQERRVERFTPPRAIHLVPVEPIARSRRRLEFAVSPPWRKRVYRDPEYEGTG